MTSLICKSRRNAVSRQKAIAWTRVLYVLLNEFYPLPAIATSLFISLIALLMPRLLGVFSPNLNVTISYESEKPPGFSSSQRFYL